MIIKLWYPKRCEFMKEVELNADLDQFGSPGCKQRFTLLRYECDPYSAKVRPIHWVFVRIGRVDYEYSHKESVL